MIDRIGQCILSVGYSIRAVVDCNIVDRPWGIQFSISNHKINIVRQADSRVTTILNA